MTKYTFYVKNVSLNESEDLLLRYVLLFLKDKLLTFSICFFNYDFIVRLSAVWHRFLEFNQIS